MNPKNSDRPSLLKVGMGKNVRCSQISGLCPEWPIGSGTDQRRNRQLRLLCARLRTSVSELVERSPLHCERYSARVEPVSHGGLLVAYDIRDDVFRYASVLQDRDHRLADRMIWGGNR